MRRLRSGLGSLQRLLLLPFLNLGAKMAVITIIGVVALIALFAYMGETALNESIQQSLQDRVVVAEIAAAHIDYTLDNLEFELTRVASHPELLDPERRAVELQSAYDQLSFFGSQLFITDGAGQVVAAYPAMADNPPLAQITPVQAVLGGAPFAVSQVAQPVAGALPLLAVAPLRDSSLHLVGSLGISIDLDTPHSRIFTNPLGVGSTGYVELVDMNGVVLASTRPAQVGEPSDHNQSLAKMILAGKPVVSRCHECHLSSSSPPPRPEVLAFAPVTRAPWGITVRQGEQEVMATARDLQMRILLLGLVALVGALFLVYLTTRSVIVPVQGLTSAAQRIAAGDLGTPIPPYGRDEIGLLARTFDTMRSHLRDSMAEVQRWIRELDARVQERTAALAAAQEQVRQSRDHLQAIIDSLGDELLVIDLQHRVTRVNAIAQRRLAGQHTVIGEHCCTVVHGGAPCNSPDCECPLERVVETGEPFRVTHMHVDGTPENTRYFDVVASPLFDAQNRVTSVVELWRDVTQENQLREALLQRNRELSAVNAIASVVGQSLKLDECLTLALTEVRRITRMDVGSIFLVEADDGTLRLHACYGISEENAESTTRQALSDSACGGVLQIGEPIVVQNPARNGRAVRDDWLASRVHVPLVAKGTPVGTLCLGTHQPTEFSQEQVSLLSAIGTQIAVAVENARLYEELSNKERVRGELLRRVISVQEEERKRIARELHDETTQTLTALLYALDAAEGHDVADMRPFTDKMRLLTRCAIDDVHKLIFDLRPTMLDQLGLVAALRWYAESRLGENGTHLEVTETGTVRRLPSTLETALFRTVQEAISNIARHAGARHVRIAFNFGEEQIEIEVEDDGIGFDMAQVSASRDPRCGLGLVSMYERLSAVDGEFYLTSAPAQGTLIRLRVPIQGGQDGTDTSADSG